MSEAVLHAAYCRLNSSIKINVDSAKMKGIDRSQNGIYRDNKNFRGSCTGSGTSRGSETFH